MPTDPLKAWARCIKRRDDAAWQAWKALAHLVGRTCYFRKGNMVAAAFAEVLGVAGESRVRIRNVNTGNIRWIYPGDIERVNDAN